MNKNRAIQITKITLSCCIAIGIARQLNLLYASSAGVIALLTIQNTKRETLAVATKRIVAFLIAIGIAFVSFSILGFHIPAFACFLLLFLWTCSKLNLSEGISMNVVVVTHLLAEGSVALPYLLNETMLLFTGMTLGVLSNLYMPRVLETIRIDQAEIDNKMRLILGKLADILVGNCVQDLDLNFDQADTLAKTALNRAYENKNNSLTSDMRYYVEYVEMRMQQTAILKRIYAALPQTECIPAQSFVIANFFLRTAASFHEYNNASRLLSDLEQMRLKFKQSPLPQCREEFEARAMLYQAVNDLEYFLLAKFHFSQGLTERQIRTFWKFNA